MKTLFVIFLSVSAFAQMSISPLNESFTKKASSQITLSNDSLKPVVATLSAKTLGLSPEGKATVLPLSKDVTVHLHDISGRIEPNTSRTFDIDARCPGKCAVMIVAEMHPLEKHEKATDDGDVHTGIHLQVALASVWYICKSEKGAACREAFKNIWSAK